MTYLSAAGMVRSGYPSSGVQCDFAPHLFAAADGDTPPGRRHGLHEEDATAPGGLPADVGGLDGGAGRGVGDGDAQSAADEGEGEADLAAGVHEGVGDELGDDEQGGVHRVLGDAPDAQRAPGEAAGVPGGLGNPPDGPALPERMTGHAVVAQQEQGDVVAAAGAFEQGVRDEAEVFGVGDGQPVGEAVHALVDVGLGGLDQTVGGQGDQGAGPQPERGHREVGLGDHAERGAAVRLGDLRAAVGVAQHRRQMSGAHAPGGALLQVEVQIDAGDEEVGLQVHQEAVGAGDDDVRGVPLDGVGAQGGAHLAHEGRGGGAVALDIADDEGDVVVEQRDHVVPVAAELQPRGAGQIAGDGDRAGQFGQAAGQQLALEHADEFVLGVQGVGAHQGLSGEARGGGEQGAFVGAEVVRGVPADEAGAGHAARGGQREDREAAGADVGEGGFEDGAGGPDLGAAVTQGGG